MYKWLGTQMVWFFCPLWQGENIRLLLSQRACELLDYLVVWALYFLEIK